MSVPTKLLWSLGGKKGIEESSEITGSIDASDTLNWKTTPLLLAVCAFIIGGTQAFGDPISCIHPLEISMWYKYVSAYCFLEGSYSIPENATLAGVVKMTKVDREKLRLENNVEYYQLIPFFLSLQLIMFFSPGVFWKWARKRESLDLDTILKQTDGIRDSMGDRDARESKMNDLVEYMYETLRPSSQARLHDHLVLTLTFLATKLITLMNVIYQFIFLVYFIGQGEVFFGYEILSDFSSGAVSSRFFPVEVLCDLSFGKLANVHPYTMQCFLSLNYFHDKMFGLLWLWYIFLMTYSTASFLIFCFSLVPIEMCIRPLFTPSLYENNMKGIRTFYSKMLFTDGLVMLKFISKHKGRHIATEIAERIYSKFEQAEAAPAWIYPDSLNMKDLM